MIPVTDCLHELLPIQFIVDPGDRFVWGRDELDETMAHKFNYTEDDMKNLLNDYLDLTQVIPMVYLFNNVKLFWYFINILWYLISLLKYFLALLALCFS